LLGEKKTYIRQELKELEQELNNGNRNADYLLHHIKGLNILGYEIKLGTRFHQPIMIEYWKVLKYDSQLPPRAMRLVKKKGVLTDDKRQL
jgi:hypothetical protein